MNGGTFALDASAAELRAASLDPSSIRAGTPQIRELALAVQADGSELGIWEMTPGVVVDVEVDEAFAVLFGRAVVEIEGGDSLILGPGSCGVLHAGDRTTWRVTETLRKVYVIAATV